VCGSSCEQSHKVYRVTGVSVFYTNVTVMDETSGASASLADQSYVNAQAP
jgi:hypothetical protein